MAGRSLKQGIIWEIANILRGHLRACGRASFGVTPAATLGVSMAPHVTGVCASWHPSHQPPWRTAC